VVAIPEGWTVWDRIDVKAVDATLAEFIDIFAKTHHGTIIDMLATPEGKVLFLGSNKEQFERNKNRKVLEIYEEVAGKIHPPNRKYVMLETTGEDADGNMAIVPKIKAFLKA